MDINRPACFLSALMYNPRKCFVACNNGTFGQDCNYTCGYCLDQEVCYHSNGTCFNGCDAGYAGESCIESKHPLLQDIFVKYHSMWTWSFISQTYV